MGLMERVKERIETTARSARRESEGGWVAVEAGASGSGSDSFRLVELEVENIRLTRLVAELLLKNQRLRESN